MRTFKRLFNQQKFFTSNQHQQTLGRPQEVWDYLHNTGNRIPQYKLDLVQETQEKFSSQSHMSVEYSQSEFLRFLVQSTNAKKGLEIGVFTGSSSISLASGFKKDDQNSQLIALDVSDEWTSIARQYWQIAGVTDKIQLIIGDAKQTLAQFCENQNNLESFDFSFIDADKQSIQFYYEHSLKLVRQGGWIAVDNVLWSNQIVDKNPDQRTQIIQNLNQFIHSDPRVDICMIPIADGLTLCYKK